MNLLDALLRPQVPVLKGDRISLSLPKRSDYAAWRDLRSESARFLRPWEPEWAPDELSSDAFAARLRRYYGEARHRTGFTFFLFDRTGTTLCGGITLGQIRRGVAQSGTLGYWMGERFAGMGLMREAVEEVARFAFSSERLHRIEAACLPQNERSIGLLSRCGFSCEGRLRSYLKIAGRWEDHCLYALLAEEWPRSNAMRARFDELGV